MEGGIKRWLSQDLAWQACAGTTRVRQPGPCSDGLILIFFVAPSSPPGRAIRTRISGSSRDHLEIYQHYLSSTRRVATREVVSPDEGIYVPMWICSLKHDPWDFSDSSTWIWLLRTWIWTDDYQYWPLLDIHPDSLPPSAEPGPGVVFPASSVRHNVHIKALLPPTGALCCLLIDGGFWASACFCRLPYQPGFIINFVINFILYTLMLSHGPWPPAWPDTVFVRLWHQRKYFWVII